MKRQTSLPKSFHQPNIFSTNFRDWSRFQSLDQPTPSKIYLYLNHSRQLSLRLKKQQNAGPKAKQDKLLDNIPNRRQSLNEWLDKILWPPSKQMQSLVQ